MVELFRPNGPPPAEPNLLAVKCPACRREVFRYGSYAYLRNARLDPASGELTFTIEPRHHCLGCGAVLPCMDPDVDDFEKCAACGNKLFEHNHVVRMHESPEGRMLVPIGDHWSCVKCATAVKSFKIVERLRAQAPPA